LFLDTAYASGYRVAVERLLVESTMKGTRERANNNVELQPNDIRSSAFGDNPPLKNITVD
jgi:hypothetical protein